MKDYEIGITCSINRKDKKKIVRVHSLLMPCSIRSERLRERLLTCQQSQTHRQLVTNHYITALEIFKMNTEVS